MNSWLHAGWIHSSYRLGPKLGSKDLEFNYFSDLIKSLVGLSLLLASMGCYEQPTLVGAGYAVLSTEICIV